MSKVNISQNNTAPMEGVDYTLYAGVIFSWSFSWYALVSQLGVVAPEVSLAWRYLLATSMMYVWVILSKRPLRFPLKTHGLFMVMGLCLFSANFYCFYQGGNYLASGFLSIMFSMASIINLLFGILFFKQYPTGRMVLGAVLGAIGVFLMFLSEIQNVNTQDSALKGFIWCLCGVLFFCFGNQVASRLKNQGVGMRSASTWGMTYGTVICLSFAFFTGAEFQIEWTARYIGSLFFLAAISSVMAFACYLGLLARIGAGRAAYATVIFPIMALLVSTVMEDFHWALSTILGVMLALVGNYFIIRPKGTS